MKSKTKGLRKLTLNDFLVRTIPMLAIKKFPEKDAEDAVRTLTELICVNQGPISICTVEEADDVFDPNGLNPSFSNYSIGSRPSLISHDSPLGRRSSIRRSSMLQSPIQHNKDGLPSKNIFRSYCTLPIKGEDYLIDVKQFVKLCKDAKFYDKSSLNTTTLELIYSRVKPQGQKKLSFKEFDQALYLIAEKKYPSLTLEEGYTVVNNDLENIVGPLVNKKLKQLEDLKKGRKDIFEKLTDVSQYTGTHVARFEQPGIEGRTQNTAGVSSLADICRQ